MVAQTYNMQFDGYWRDQIRASIPDKSGVYLVYECTNQPDGTVRIHKLIYIGEADNVQKRLENHEKRPRWLRHVRPGNELCYSFGPIASPDRQRVEAAYIFHHKPPENDEYKNSFPFDRTRVITTGRAAFITSDFTVDRTP